MKSSSQEKVLESWAVATSTSLLTLSGFLAICKHFLGDRPFNQLLTVFYFCFISCLLNGLQHHALLFAQHFPVIGRVKAQGCHRQWRPWPLGLRQFRAACTAVHVLWFRPAPHTSLPAARMMEGHSELRAAQDQDCFALPVVTSVGLSLLQSASIPMPRSRAREEIQQSQLQVE